MVVIGTPNIGTEFVRNFNPFAWNRLVGTIPCIYEPLMISDPSRIDLIPWLAESYTWGSDHLSLVFSLRRDVRWSDGSLFKAADVVFTFNLLSEMRSQHQQDWFVDQIPENLDQWVESVAALDDFRVAFTFKAVNTLIVYDIIAQPIIPQHIWQFVEDGMTFPNEHPVGTGPFTQVTRFEQNVELGWRLWQLERNPYYWQEGKPAVNGIRFWSRYGEYLAKDLLAGDIDWTIYSDPAVAADFVNKDIFSNHTITETGTTVLLDMNTARLPFNQKEVRQAISMAIDREKIIEKILAGRAIPVSPTGLRPEEQRWLNPDAERAGFWMNYNPLEAERLLDRAGLTRGSDGLRVGPDSKTLRLSLMILSPYDSLIADILTQNLRDIGLWVGASGMDSNDNYDRANYDLAVIIRSPDTATPYEFYHSWMSASGTHFFFEKAKSKTNSAAKRYTNLEAGQLLDEFIRQSEFPAQKSVLDQLQMIFVEDIPVIPLFTSYYPVEYTTRRFVGFPTPQDHYAPANPYAWTGLLVLLNLK